LLLDAAHNADGAAALAAFLAAEDSEPSPLVFGTLADKDVVEMVRALAPSISAMVLTRGAVSRFFEPAELFNTVKTAAPRLRVVAAPSIAQALEIAWRISPRIVVAGSLFLVGDVMKELKLS
jgi:dihydrofolate synthase/folylpolyglutamate synthase